MGFIPSRLYCLLDLTIVDPGNFRDKLFISVVAMPVLGTQWIMGRGGCSYRLNNCPLYCAISHDADPTKVVAVSEEIC